MTIRRRFRTREAWLRYRRIGSSDVAAILGRSSKSPWEVYERITTGAERRAGPEAERGRRLEPKVLAGFERETELELVRAPDFTLYERDEWATATPDARLLEDGAVVEAKTDRSPWRWGPAQPIVRWEKGAEEIVRPDYYLQVVHQLWVCDAPRGFLTVLLPLPDPFEFELRTYPIERDREIEEAWVETGREFWRRTQAGEPPELDGSDAAQRWVAGRPRRQMQRRATKAEAELALELHTATTAEKKWRDEKKRLAQEVLVAAADAKVLYLPRGKVTVIETSGRDVLDEKNLLAHHPELEPVFNEFRHRTEPSLFPRIYGLGGDE